MTMLIRYFLISLTIILFNACGNNDDKSSSNNFSSAISEDETKNDDISEKKGLGALIPTEEMLQGVPVALIVSSYTPNQLPSSYDLSSYMPPVRSQGEQGSCASWAVGYYLKSYHEYFDKNIEYGKGNDYAGVYSPAFLYNKVKIDSCDDGSYIYKNLERVRDAGISSWKDMPYNDKECDTEPSVNATNKAKCTKIIDYQRIRTHQPIESVEIQDMKFYLANNNPLVVGIRVYDGFSNPEKVNGEFFYKNYSEKGYSGGHAIVVVGYNDNKNAFKIINSWGKNWGNDGFLWIDYDVFSQIVFEVYRTEDAKNECEEGSSFISIDKQSLVFNTKEVGSSSLEVFNLLNNGSSSFNVSDITVPNGYKVDWNRGLIKAGDSQEVTVTFNPTEDKSYNGKLTIINDADKGKNTIELIGSGIDGESPNMPPIAKAGEDITVKVGERVKLDASKSYDSDGEIVAYEWKIGSEVIGNSKILEKDNLDVGIYRITLKVTDNEGISGIDTMVLTIKESNIPPLAQAGDDIYAKFGDNVTLTSYSSDKDGKIIAYEWKDDGKILSKNASFSKKDFSVGKHTITLKVTDDKGATDKDIIIVTIAKKGNIAPVAEAGEDIEVPLASELFLDASKSYDSDGKIVDYSWKYNGGYSRSTSNPKLRFVPYRLYIGTYTFTLTVTDNDGETDIDTVKVTVVPSKENIPPIANISSKDMIFTYEETTIISRPKKKITLDGSSSYDYDGKIVKYRWKEGDILLSKKSSFSKDDFSSGEHIITLTVTDNNGANGSEDIKVIIGRENNIPPVADAGKRQTINLGDELFLDASGSYDSDGEIVEYYWYYNGGFIISPTSTTSFIPNITGEARSYTFTLLVTDNDGGTDIDTVTITVK